MWEEDQKLTSLVSEKFGKKRKGKGIRVQKPRGPSRYNLQSLRGNREIREGKEGKRGSVSRLLGKHVSKKSIEDWLRAQQPLINMGCRASVLKTGGKHANSTQATGGLSDFALRGEGRRREKFTCLLECNCTNMGLARNTIDWCLQSG